MPGQPAPAVDIIIVGAGFAGALLAISLQRSGRSVVLVDEHPQMKPVFRAEKLETAQSQRLRALGVLDLRLPLAPPTGRIIRFDAAGERVVDTGEQYGISYHDTVNALRRAALASARLVVAKVVDLVGCADGHGTDVVLDNGQRLRGRVVVLACGYRPGLHKRMATGLVQDPALRSLFVGFDIRLHDPDRFAWRGGNEHIDQGAGGIDYLTFFRVGDRLRANLSAQLRADDPRNRLLRSNPEACLQQWFPRLTACTGGFSVASRLQQFVTTYYRIVPPDLPGVVAVGDAFQSANPANGTGLSKILTDLELLSDVFLPRWLASGQCGRAHVQDYYAHSRKLQQDNQTHVLWKSFQLNARQRQRQATAQQIRLYFDPRHYTLDRLKRKLGLA